MVILISGLTGLYRGISTNVASSAPISAVYTFTYESVKGALLPLFPKVPLLLCNCPYLFFLLSSIANRLLHSPQLIYAFLYLFTIVILMWSLGKKVNNILEL